MSLWNREHNIDSSNLEKEIKETKVRLCLDCGKCTVVCPVSQYSEEFNPRLIIQRRLNSPQAETPLPQDETIWSCLNCQMCIERCNYQVKFPEFITALRTEAVKDGARVQCSHGGTLQSIMHMMARKGLQQERLDWLPDDIVLTEQSETRFFVGCAPYFDVIFEDIGVKTLDGVIAALRLLNNAQIPFNLLADERCCGRDLLLQGDREGFTALAKANAADFTRHGVKRIITNCPECYSCLKTDYPKITGNNSIQVVSLVEVLAPLVKNKKITAGSVSKKVTYHDPCTLGRGLRVFDEPRQLLAAAPGLQLVEMENNREKSLCCGANPWANCGTVNRQIQGQRLDQAKAVGAEILVTACPKCQIHLKCAQKNADGKSAQIEIRDLASLIEATLTEQI
ncbi:MAG TPA: (Fe-S)-binding protein [Dehalococcoidales bacterium]